ncbi:MAG: lysophospholipase L1-like esterase [Planctomycetota bacterium]|jgi:lysophospholipase L1-like esterase
MSSAPPNDRPSARLPILHKLMLSLFVSVATAEIFFRVDDAYATPPRDAEFYLPIEDAKSLYVPHPHLSTVLKPGFVRKPVPGSQSYATRINSLGMRGKEMTVEKPPGVFRILCLGGSTTYGTATSESRYSYPAQLETMLNSVAPEGIRYQVGNCGVPGYLSNDSLINLQLRLLDYEPDALLIYHAANDSRPIQARGFKSDYSHLRKPWSEEKLSTTELFLMRYWRTFARLTRGTDPEEQLRSMGTHILVPNYRELHIASNVGVPPKGILAFRRNIKSIVGVAREHGIQTVLQTFAVCPSRFRQGNEHFFGTIRDLNITLRGYAAESEVPIIEVAEELYNRNELYDDWMHLNDEGSRVHAEIIFNSLREQGLFNLPAPVATADDE